MRTALLGVLTILAIIDTAIRKTSIVVRLDSAIVSSLYDMRLHWPWLVASFLLITHMGSVLVVLALTAALALWCVHRQWRSDAVWLVSTVAFARLLGWFAKLLLQSPRPSIPSAPPIYGFAGYGFPSGHSLMSIVVYGAAALLIIRHAKTRATRIWGALACAFIIAAIGSSRVYLGAHWANDVVGGYLYGACVVTGTELLRIKLVKHNHSHP